MSGRNGYGGPGERRIVVDPRAAFRARQRQLSDDDPISAPPPSLLGDETDDQAPDTLALAFPDQAPPFPQPFPQPYRWSKELLNPDRISEPDDEFDPVRETLRLRIRPGHRSDRTARVRVYHRLKGAPEAGFDGRCWAFTITRVAYEKLLTERVLDSEGATWPDGQPVVPPDVDPLYVPIRCGSCGTQRVECLQMECWQE